jgi:hypothetical protein
MPSCKKMTELLSDSLETHLPWTKRWSMQLHLLICKTCRRYRRHLLFIQKTLAKMDGHQQLLQLPEAARQRIKDKLSEKPK